MNCFQSSLREENPSDIPVDDIVKELLSYFKGFQCVIDAKRKIEIECDIEEKSIWSADDIKRAWRETERMKKKSRRKHWSRVIVLQELKRRVYNDQRNAETDQQEDKDTQACGTAQEDTDSRSFESNTELIDDDSQGAEDMKKINIENLSATKRKKSAPNVAQKISPGHCGLYSCPIPNPALAEAIHIRIPLSVISDNDPNPIPKDKTDFQDDNNINNSTYKLIDGFPSRKEIKKRKSYVMSYNNLTKNADWVYEILNKDTIIDNAKEEFGKGYDKGHLAAAANHRWCLEAKNDASLFSNIAPQDHKLNIRTWRALEEKCRKTAKERTDCNVHVYTGPLYTESNLMWVGGKALPSHFFKVIIVENKNGIVEEPECYLLPNKPPDGSEERYKVNIETFQEQCGLTFIDFSPSVTNESIKTIKWQGKGENGELCTANIEVRISS